MIKNPKLIPVNNSSIDIICATIKLWCRILGNSKQVINKANANNNGLSDDMNLFLDMAFQCIHSQGEYLVEALPISRTSNEGMEFEADTGDEFDGFRASLRVTCASCVIELLKLHSISKGLNVMQWQVLGWAFLDSEFENRELLIIQFGDLIQRYPIHPRFLSYPCILANDEKLCNLAQGSLTRAIKRLRCTHESLVRQALSAQGEDIENLRVLAQAHLPESILPYVLYLLSHHPNFPKSATMEDKEDQYRLKGVIQSVRMTISGLLDTLENSGRNDNLSLIFKQVNMISQYYKDRLDQDNLGLHFVTQVTTKLLKERIKTAENVQSYPGDILLPMDLYMAYDNSEMSNNQKSLKNSVLSEAESAVDKVLGYNSSHSNQNSKPKRKPGVAKTIESNKSKKFKGNAEDNSENEDEDVVKPMKKNVLTNKKHNKSEEIPVVRVSSRPTRSAKEVPIKYNVPDESESEMEAWEAAAANTKAVEQKKRK